jgi:uncharacterized protein YyaL (SSP411 family)
VLGNLMGNTRYVEAAERTLLWSSGHVQQAPSSFSSLLSAVEDHLYAPALVLLTGPAVQLPEWQAATRTGYTPWRHVYAIPNDVPAFPPPLRPPYLPRVTSSEDRGRVVAFVCTGTECSLPMRDIAALKKALGN